MLRRSFVAVTFATTLVASAVAAAPAAAPASATTASTREPPSPQQRAQAARYVKIGKALYAKHHYEEALTALGRSYELVPSPATRVSIARVYRAMGRIVAAYDDITKALEDAKVLAATNKRYAELVKKWTLERAMMERALAFITVNVTHPDEETTVHVGGGVIDREAWGEKIAVAPGTLEIVVATPDREPVRQSVSLAAAEAKTVEVDAGAAPAQVATSDDDGADTEPSGDAAQGKDILESDPVPGPGPASRERLRPYGWIAGGVGLVGLGAFAGFGLMAKSRYSDLRSACDPACPSSKSDEISSGRTFETLANVGLAVGILGAVSSVALFTLSRTKSSDTPPATARASTSVVVGPSFVGLRGSM